MSAHLCKTVTDGCYRCELNRDEVDAFEAEDRADVAAAWVEYRNVFMLGRPIRQRTMLRKRDFLAGFIAARQS